MRDKLWIGLVNRRDAAVAQIALARIVLHEARAAEDGNRALRVAHSLFSR